jgi:hypothetical protein
MKRIFYLISLLCLALAGPATRAQSKSLELYYIAHDHYETALSSILAGVHDEACNNPRRTVVFYLANGSSPLMFLVSKGDEDAYSAFIDELTSRTAHPVQPLVDRDNLLDLFSGKGILPTEGFDAYNKVILNFYVTPGFVSMDYGDALIGSLYWDMDLEDLSPNALQINVFHSPDNNFPPGRLFGRKKLTGNFPVRIASF